MKIVIFYFSGTGNTWRIAQSLHDVFASQQIPVELHSIESLTQGEILKIIARNDIVGFGYPIYGSDIPLIMQEFLKQLPVPEHPIPIFVFCTQWMFSGDGTQVSQEFFPSPRYQVRWSEHFFTPNNVCVSVLRLPYTTDQRKIAAKFNHMRKRMDNLVKHISTGTSHRRGFGFFSKWIGLMQRAPFRKYFGAWRNDIGIDGERCSRCGLCARICPVGNIDRVTLVPQARCILCVRCYNFCPENAITYRDRLHDRSRGAPYRGPAGFRPEQMKDL
ncbi:MAG: hypothetical protein CVV52_16105 [Spirochaetae bacterium HGW-Spirochaetae-8]|jgi:ferredoxin|nr:MAG: hypothetical protein CVV52_16105 [Spirochaetae bacterium HGW-Spirochaetae-8]